MPMFELGCTATPTEIKFCEENNVEPIELPHRHATGDWG